MMRTIDKQYIRIFFRIYFSFIVLISERMLPMHSISQRRKKRTKFAEKTIHRDFLQQIQKIDREKNTEMFIFENCILHLFYR